MENTKEVEKVTANETVVAMILAINADRKDLFYKAAEAYRDSLVTTSKFRYELTVKINNRPKQFRGLAEMDRNVRGLLLDNEQKEGHVHINSSLKDFVSEIVQEWENKDTYRYHNIPVRSKILMHGPTGNGKTTIAKHIASLSRLPLFVINSDMVVSSQLGSTGSNIFKIFEAIKEPCVLFWDEVDTIGKKRGSSDSSSASNENDRMVNSMLINIEKMASDVIFIGATNRMDIMDPAFLRRFDDIVLVDNPTFYEKSAFLESLGEYYKIDRTEWGAMNISSMGSYSEIKKNFIKKARSFISQKIKEEMA